MGSVSFPLLCDAILAQKTKRFPSPGNRKKVRTPIHRQPGQLLLFSSPDSSSAEAQSFIIAFGYVDANVMRISQLTIEMDLAGRCMFEEKKQGRFGAQRFPRAGGLILLKTVSDFPLRHHTASHSYAKCNASRLDWLNKQSAPPQTTARKEIPTRRPTSPTLVTNSPR